MTQRDALTGDLLGGPCGKRLAPFVNQSLLDYCLDDKITFTRSRPSRSNDNAHVEQAAEVVALSQLFALSTAKGHPRRALAPVSRASGGEATTRSRTS